MRSDPIFALIVGVVLILLVVLSRWLCHSGKSTPAATKPPRATHEPKYLTTNSGIILTLFSCHSQKTFPWNPTEGSN